VPPRKNDGSARRPQRAEAVHFALRVLVATHSEGTEVMSRGLGKIERTILDDITIGGPSSVLIHSWGLLCHHNCFRRPANWNFEPTTAERKAVTRAMRSFVRKFPQYALTGSKERKMLYLYEPADPISAMWAKLSVERPKFVSRSEAMAALPD
jgi:hypothetical protein